MARYAKLEGNGDGYLSFEDVLSEEQACIEESRGQRAPGDPGGNRFSLAFSGGGIRAAAFQAGVLWRLAEEDRLKDVDYFTAVSGGGYITSAFASHCVGAEKLPESASEVKAFYLDVVAKTLCRMQRNAGDFVRDCVSLPGVPEDGAGVLPRCLDLPVLLATLFLTVLVLPLFFSVCILVPFAISVELFFGSAMRAVFCAPITRPGWLVILQDQTNILLKWSPWEDLLYVLGGALVAFFFVWMMRKVLPCCKLRPPRQVDGRPVGRKQAPCGYLLGYAASCFLKRFIVGVAIVVLLPYYTSVVHSLMYQPDTATVLCRRYAKERLDNRTVHSGCSEYYDTPQEPWWKDKDVVERPGESGRKGIAEADKLLEEVGHFHVFLRLVQGLGALALFGAIIAPLCGAELLKRVIFVAGPVLLFVLTVEFTQFRVYGPITRNVARQWTWNGIDLWDDMVNKALMACVVILPFLAELRATFHYYYRRSLYENYYHGGKDISIQELKDNPYCPFILMTGTACDFKPPGESDTISEISFSALHCGGEETGYVPMPYFQTLATCTALTGAGCLDAISLTMSDLMTLRFWLEVFNLTWGDYIFFQPEGSWPRHWTQPRCLGNALDHVLVPKLLRIPSFLPLLLVYFLLFFGWHTMLYKDADCQQVRLIFRAAIIGAVAIVGASFFTSIPCIGLLSMSPVIRRIHQLSMYFYKGNHPPKMLYVTDGGVKDCTSVLQLLARRQERMLLVLAAADPRDELGVLKAAMQVARSLKLCSFYDPEDPRRDTELLFSRYQEDKDMPYLHLGVSYCWSPEDGGPSTGHLFVVKNRLPGRCTAQPVKPLVMEDEIRGQARMECDELFSKKWKGMTTDKLGPFGCCDCCHTSGLNCGPKFPHGAFTGYLYLSPQWCNSLIRLGYEVSAEAVDGIANSLPLSAGWEAHVKPSAQ